MDLKWKKKIKNATIKFHMSSFPLLRHFCFLKHPYNDASSAPNTSNTEELLGLPSASASNESINTTARLEALGPVVVNEDGSISRINNWKEMTENERKILERVLLKRNAQRLALLRGQDTNNTENNKDNQ
ncbi:hypothetical protein BDF19DRAFT_447532 [Syncephalis fuscata]|nr:hypothetical protein BDF19DRAFT_447532 [Syncephalis fuscata]